MTLLSSLAKKGEYLFMAHERICCVDMKEYKYCPNCRQYNTAEKWRLIYCSENCREIYHVCDAYKAGKITAEEAVKKFEKLNMPKFEELHKLIKPIIEEIYDKATTPAVVVEEVKPFVVEEITPIVEEPKFKKRNKIVNEIVEPIIPIEE